MLEFRADSRAGLPTLPTPWYLTLSRRLRIENPHSWDHHRGGWRDVVQSLSERLHAPSGVRFLSSVDDQMAHYGPVEEPWVGFVHQVPRQKLAFPDLERLVQLADWRTSLPYCCGLWVLTNYQRVALRDLGITVPISVVRYSIAESTFKFSPDAVRVQPRLVMIGEYLRNWQAFYDLQAPGYEKIILGNDEFTACQPNLRINDSVRIQARLVPEEYDRLLSECVVFLHLFDAVGVTTMVECIMAGTPLLINPVGAVREYMGENYPLYFETLDEATEKLVDTKRVLAASQYLANLPIRDEFRLDTFATRLQNTTVYRSLPNPDPPRHFRRRDLSILLCSYQRVETLPDILDRFARQEFPGSFELLLWNNNIATWPILEKLAYQFRDRLDLKLIQSSENYYCATRLGVPALTRT